MPDIVVDASALVAMVFGEAAAEAVAEQLGDAPLVAPALIWFELANACRKKIKRNPEQKARLLDALRRAPDMQIGVRDIDHLAVVALALHTGLSTYDASYLWLARHLNAELVTLDEPLRTAARR
jgi:predicted nucleic acid-binding protein